MLLNGYDMRKNDIFLFFPEVIISILFLLLFKPKKFNWVVIEKNK